MSSAIKLGDLVIAVDRKDIKNVHLSVYPPNGRVRIAAPERMPLTTIRAFALGKLGWIKKQQRQIRAQERESPREYVDRESHFVWGKRYLLKVSEKDVAPVVELTPRHLLLQIRPQTSKKRRHQIVEEWYRDQIREALPSLLEKWQKALGVKAGKVFVRCMRTKWGSCQPRTKSIRLNTDLAKKPRECLEYIVLHELLHLIEPTHSQRFLELMHRHMPKWPSYRNTLNRLPVRHEDWSY
jgi:predicted metal-dependent hydrolase